MGGWARMNAHAYTYKLVGVMMIKLSKIACNSAGCLFLTISSLVSLPSYMFPPLPTSTSPPLLPTSHPSHAPSSPVSRLNPSTYAPLLPSTSRLLFRTPTLPPTLSSSPPHPLPSTSRPFPLIDDCFYYLKM